MVSRWLPSLLLNCDSSAGVSVFMDNDVTDKALLACVLLGSVAAVSLAFKLVFSTVLMSVTGMPPWVVIL